MLTFTSKNALKGLFGSITTVGALSTFYFHINPTQVASATQATILYFDATRPVIFYIASSKLYVQHVGRFDDGLWSCPISTGNQQICLTYTMTNDNTTPPVIYINGTLQTVTEETAPNTTNTISSATLYVGGVSEKSSSSPFTGDIGEIAIWGGTGLSAAKMIQLTTSRMMGMPQQYSCTHYFAMDEVKDGVAITTDNIVKPNSNVAFTWATGTGYTDINAWLDSNTITATKDDDGETVEFGMETATVSEPVVGVNVQTLAQVDNTSVQATVSVYMDAAYQTYQALGNTGTSQESQLHYFHPTSLTTLWDQTDVDNMQLALKAAATIGKDERNVFDYVPIHVYSGKLIRDRVGATIGLFGGDSGTPSTAPTGKANNYLSYQ